MSSGNVGGQRAVVETANEMRAAGRAFALIVVVRTEGSTYRKPGALALVGADGVHVGVISGGCLESGVELLARDALGADAPTLAVFDTRSDDDLVFGSGSGCRGRMYVLALPSASSRLIVDAIIDAGRNRRPAHAHDRRARARCAHERRVDDPAATTGAHDRRRARGAAAARYRPHARLYCCIVDHREALLAPARIGLVDRRLSQRPAPALRELAAERFDAALVMTHVADADLEALRALAGVDIEYIGLLGPAGRRDELLARLSAPERDALNGRLHAPVGLPLGGKGPEAIALSIAAELQKTNDRRMSTPPHAVVVLAAGGSSRFGDPRTSIVSAISRARKDLY
jgi:xanthine dehydrogenase accessory factor